MSIDAMRARLCRVCGAEAPVAIELHGVPCRVQTLLRPDQMAGDRTQDLQICKCSACGLVQLAEDPDHDSVYPTDYLFSVNFSEHARAYQNALAERWVREHGLSGKQVLEVGGGGFFAELLQSHGCRVTLVEPAPRACQIARERALTRVIEDYLTADTFPNERFEAVVMRHVLEHVPEPLPLLSLAHLYLADGGKLFIEVPNLDAIIAKIRLQDFYAEHLLYFDSHSLVQAMSKSGLKVLELYTIERGDYLVCVGQASASNFEQMLGDLGAFRTRVRTLLQEAVGAGRRVGIYGADGRGVALLALIGARDLGLAYVVDLDPKKWGCFTPATHLPVVSPDHLRSDPVDDLLISAVAFQDEIIQQLGWFPRDGRRLGVLDPKPRWLDTV